jgi:hypothetical protein
VTSFLADAADRVSTSTPAWRRQRRFVHDGSDIILLLILLQLLLLLGQCDAAPTLRPIRRTLRFARSSQDGDTAQRLRILVAAVETPLRSLAASLSIAVLDSGTSW